MRSTLAWSALFLSAPAASQDASITGELTRADFETYREVPVDVPAGADRVTVRLTYDKADKTVVDLGLWDPVRFRGWSGGTRDRMTVSATDASPGYLSGSLPPGRWKVMLGVPNIRPGVRSRYRIDVWFDTDKRRAATAAIENPPLRPGPGWYRGDLHMHDANSDGSCVPRGKADAGRVPCPLFKTVEAAAASGLDFIAVTNHNTVAQFGGLRELQPWAAPMLLIPGVEITTFHGHANIFAPSRFVDFRLATRNGVRALQDEVDAAGAALSINHPSLPSGEICMGCGWTWPDTDWSKVAAIEVINGERSTGPLSGLTFWYDRLDAGLRVTGIAGSDNHNPDAPPGQAPIGRPTTVVRASNLSTPAIMQGIRDGNVFIDVEGTRDRILEVKATQGGKEVEMGGALSSKAAIRLHVLVRGAAATTLKLVGTGAVVLATRRVTDNEQGFVIPLAAGSTRRWFAIAVERGGRPLLLGNPIYLQ